MKYSAIREKIFYILLFVGIFAMSFAAWQESPVKQIIYRQNTYPLYPQTLDSRPDIPSPFTTEDSMEIMLASTKDGEFALIPVTVEDGAPLLYSRRIQSLFGKDKQLQVASGDFPVLAETGLHSEPALKKKSMIAGYPISIITYIGRPGRFSWAGFMAEDEDILSVLIGDNRLVQHLSLTHPHLAKPLFHVWNIILEEIEHGKMQRFTGFAYFVYNGRRIFLEAEGTKGWQTSIFQDEIQGRFDIHIYREFTDEENSFLKRTYSRLSVQELDELKERLSHIHFSEMAPYYIMRYGFYEGHTDYRADPLAVSFIFGLKTLKEIDYAFAGNLDRALKDHFTEEAVDR
ncbi:MAG: hypothetical protein JXB23_06925 [Candidatus Aminicenantes bacterium]|nr:hypothetical protein [Candidatus Aminicenantes bacterium]